MEKKVSWNKPVCMTVSQEELDAKVTVASCSLWFPCSMWYYLTPPTTLKK